MILTLTPLILLLLLLIKKLHRQFHQLFLEKNTQNNKNFTFSHYSLNHIYSIGTTRNIRTRLNKITSSLQIMTLHAFFVPQEALNLNDDFLSPTKVPTSVANFFPKQNKLVETTLDNHSRSLYTCLVQKNSIAQLNFIIAKLSSFILNKQNKYLPATTNIPDEKTALPKHILSYTNLEIKTVPPPTFVQQPPPSYVLQTVDPTVCINSFSYPTDKFVTGFESSPPTC